MEFPVPVAADLADVGALNRAFLRLLADSAAGSRLRAMLPQSLRAAAAATSPGQVARLGEAPFLLLCLREHDLGYWQQLVDRSPCGDLFTVAEAHGACQQLTLAALAFAWQLGRHDPYSASVVCGVSRSWCELVCAFPLATLLDRAGGNPKLLAPRLAEDARFWGRLFRAGCADDNEVRRAAQLSCLQTVLMRVEAEPRQRYRSAACAGAAPVVQRSGVRSGK